MSIYIYSVYQRVSVLAPLENLGIIIKTIAKMHDRCFGFKFDVCILFLV